MSSPGKCFTKDKDIVTRDVAGETIIVPIRGRVGDLDAIYTLNEAGSLIWQHLENRPTVPQLVDAVVTEYDVATGEAKKDVEDFLESLEAVGLIRRQ